MKDKLDLDHCAYAVVGRYRQDRSNGVPGNGWTLTWKRLIRELRSDCPGFSDLEYGIALTNRLTDPRPGDTPP